MHIGRFDRKISIVMDNEIQYTSDDYGGLSEISILETPTSWWAEIKADNGNESVNAGKVTTVQYITFIMRYHASITVHARITYDSKTYIAESIREVYGRKRYLEVKCRLIDGGA